MSRLRSSSRTRSDRLTCENCAVAKRLSSSRHTESILSMSIFHAVENFILYTLNRNIPPPVSTLIHWSIGRFMANQRRKKNERGPHGIIDLRMINDLINDISIKFDFLCHVNFLHIMLVTSKNFEHGICERVISVEQSKHRQAHKDRHF